jgi:hypothetical protein
MTPEQLIAHIAARIGVQATICQSPADYCSDNERVIAAVNEADADDRPVVDEAPFCDAPQVEPEEPPTVQDAVDLIYGNCRLTGRHNRNR